MSAQTTRFKPVGQFNRAVMTDAKSLGETADAGHDAQGGPNHQQGLVLLWCQSFLAAAVSLNSKKQRKA